MQHPQGRKLQLQGSWKKDKAKAESKMDGINYGCTKQQCGTVPKVATNNNRNILLNSTDSTSVSPKFISYKHAVLNKPTKINLRQEEPEIKFEENTTLF